MSIMTDPTNLYIFAIICLALGYFTSTLLHTLSDDNKKKKTADPNPLNASDKEIFPATHPQELLSAGIFLRKSQTGDGIQVALDGENIPSAADLSEVQRSRLMNTLLDLSTWLKNPAPARPAMVDSPVTPAPIAPAPVPSSPAISDAEVIAQLPTPAIEPATFTLNPAKILQRALKAEVPKIQAPLSIVTQVNDILQHKIAGTHWAVRGLQLTEAPDHTMLVTLGLEKYNGMDAIPEEEIRNLIRQCVTEWSNRTQ
jgi:hypothetical protein